MRKKNFWTGIGILTVCAALGLGGCQSENPKIPEKTETSAEETDGTESSMAESSRIETVETEIGETEASQKPSSKAEEKTAGDGAEEILTAPPDIQLSDSLSSSYQPFSVSSGSYTWNMKGNEDFEGVVACGTHPLEMNGDTPPLYVTDYHQMTKTPYLVSCPVMPDQIRLTSWDRSALGNVESSAEEMVVYEEQSLIDLEAGKVYALTAVWEKEEEERRGFSGEAQYVFWTDSRQPGQSEQEKRVRPEHIEPLNDMALYTSYPFSYGEKEWELRKFVQKDMLIDGELAMDDRCHFAVSLTSGENEYWFFDETVQLGEPQADVWIDADDQLHVVLRDSRTARYQITDFVYNPETDEFVGRNVISEDGINYLGTTE